MGRHSVFNVDTAVEIFVDLYILVDVLKADLIEVVGLGKEPGGAQYHDRKAEIRARKLTEVLRRCLCDTVDVRGIETAFSVIQFAGAPGSADRARPNALVELVNTKLCTPATSASSSKMSVPEIFVSTNACWLRDPMLRLLQRRSVDYAVDAIEGLADDFTVGDRTKHVREQRINNVETNDFVSVTTQGADECLTQMPGTSGDEDPVVPHFSHDKGQSRCRLR